MNLKDFIGKETISQDAMGTYFIIGLDREGRVVMEGPEEYHTQDLEAFMSDVHNHRITIVEEIVEEKTIRLPIWLLIEKNKFADVCELEGYNPWMVNEGLADKNDELSIKLSTAQKLGLM